MTEELMESIADLVSGDDDYLPLVLQTRGILPARQARSKATFLALIDAGLRMIETKEFPEITVDAVANAAKASVGAFYERFSSKETFFAALQEIVAIKIERAVQARIASANFATLSPEAAIAAIMETWLEGVRIHRGLMRASLRHIPVREDAWFPLKKLGQRMGTLYLEALRPHMSKMRRASLERRIRIALQIVHGVAVNTILNNPGPLSLDDKEFEVNLNRIMYLLLGLDMSMKTPIALT